MAVKNSFSMFERNLLTKKFGGSQGVVQPYTSGTFFVWFSSIPEKITDYTKTGSSGLGNITDVRNVLAGACTGFTPPGGTVNVVEFPGLGGLKWGVPGAVDYGNTFSIKFLEFSTLPITDIMHSWVKLMRDYRFGISEKLDGSESGGITHDQYSGTVYYWTTSPDGQTIQNYTCYDGVFPLRDPQDLFSSDIETIARVDIELDFHVDYMWREDWVKTACQSFTQYFMNAKDKIKESYRPA